MKSENFMSEVTAIILVTIFALTLIILTAIVYEQEDVAKATIKVFSEVFRIIFGKDKDKDS